ncbi:MAG TPA: tetratricopeptide repeat protein, partial [Pirellulales bacterium]
MTRKFVAAVVVAWALCTLLASPLAAQAPAAAAAQQAKLAERNRLWEQAQQLRAAGKTADAIAAGEKMLAIERELYRQPTDDLAVSLGWLGQRELERESFSQAEKRFQEALDIRTAVLGGGHWKVTDARLQVEQARLLAKLNPRDRQDLRNAEQANRKLVRLYGEGQYQAAIELAEKCRVTRLRLLGEAHPDYATSLNNLAELYRSMGDYARAEPLFRQAMEIRKKVLGEAHPDYATSLNNLAALYVGTGDYARAEPLYRQAMEIRKKALGEAHPDYATDLNNLAELYRSLGDYARAEPLYRQAAEINKKALGEAHPNYAGSLNNLALLYQSMGDYARAEPLYRQAAAVTLEGLQQSFLGESQRQQLAHAASVR